MLDDEAREKRRVVRHQLLGRKRLDLRQQRVRHATRPRHRLVVEEVLDLARGRLPAHVPDLTRLRAPAFPIGLGRVVVVARLGVPWAHDLRVERPVRNVDAVHAVDERAALQLAGREPLARVPPPDLLADARVRHDERQQALRPDGRLDFLIVDERRRAAEVAVLADALGVEDRDGLAALALDGALLGLPAAVLVGNLAQRLGEIELFDHAGRGVDGERRRRAAERADEQLLCRVPLRLRAARRARILVESADVGHSWKLSHEQPCADGDVAGESTNTLPEASKSAPATSSNRQPRVT